MLQAKGKRATAVLLIAALGGGGIAPAADVERARVDRLDDPLPPRAVARIGTVRWWAGLNYRPLVYAPDGKSLVVAEDGGIVRVLDAATGKELRRIEIPDAYETFFVLAPDGKSMIAGSSSGAALLRLWDVSSSKQLRRITDKETEIKAAAFSPDGKTFAAATTDKAGIRLWDTATWKETRRLTAKGARESDHLFFLRDGKTLIAGDAESIRWWDIRTGREIRRLDKDTHAGIYWQTVASDGKRLAAFESVDRKKAVLHAAPDLLHLWDAASGEEIGRIAFKKKNFGHCLCFSRDGETLACSHGLGWRGNQTLFFAAATGRELRRWHDDGEWTYHVAFSPDGKILAQQNVSGVIHRRDADTGKRIGPNAGLPDHVRALAFAPDGKTLIATIADGRTGLWNPLTGEQRGPWQAPLKDFAPPYFLPGKDRIQGVALSADGAKAALVDAKGVLRVWQTATGKACCRIAEPPPCDTQPIFSPDGRILAVDHKDHTLRLWDTTTGKPLRAFPQEMDTFCHRIAFSPDGRTLATHAIPDEAEEESAIHLWETATGKEMGRLTWRDEELPIALLFSVDGKHLLAVHALASDDGADENCSIRLWDPATQRERRRFPMPLDAGRSDSKWWGTMALSPDGKTLATTTKQDILLWELASGKERGRLIGHREEVKSLAFSPDGRLLASGGRDHTALVWDVTGTCPDGQWSVRDTTATEMERLWTDLAGADCIRAYRAVWTMAAARQAVPFLAKRLRPMPGVADERLRQLIADLDSEQFETRRRATRELEQLSELAEPALRAALAGKPSLEVRRRLRALLDPLESGTLSSEQLRALRALEVLEYTETPEARKVLKSLADGAAAARLTREAKASLERVSKRRPPKP